MGSREGSIRRDIRIPAGSKTKLITSTLLPAPPLLYQYITCWCPCAGEHCASLFSLTLAFLLGQRLLIIFWLPCLSSFVMIIAEFLSCHPPARINGCRLPLCHIGSANSPSSLNEAPLASLSICCLSSWALEPLLGQSIHHSSNQSLTFLYHAWARSEWEVRRRLLYVHHYCVHFKAETAIPAGQGHCPTPGKRQRAPRTAAREGLPSE